ncbi:cytochrome P450 [Marasmius fiardii PR-910]|nr:cytochrome P450 [Marasmius fiardii PR-910]
MVLMSLLLQVLGIISFAILLASFFSSKSKRNRSLPPGPPPDPLIGHLRIIPSTKTGEAFHEWSKTYGDVMYFKSLGREMIVLGSLDAAQSLLEVRGANHSCRPKFTIFELMGWDPSLTFMQYGKRFLKHRKMFQQYFGRKESLAFDHLLAEEAHLLVKNLSNAVPGKHTHHVQRFTLSNIMQAAFGHPVRSDDDPFVRITEGVMYGLNNCGAAGNTPPDFFPWLRHLPSWFPGNHFASVARSYFGVVRELHDEILGFVQEGMKTGTIEKCFASDMLKDIGDDCDQESIEDVKGAAATAVTGGEDTTFATLMTFLLAMVLHPDIQKRAYDEIISAIGHDRLPDLSDREKLPFVDCILRETFRWHPSVPLGVPHHALKDDVYNKMFIPKGAMVVANIVGMSMDGRVYSNPNKFDPARYLPMLSGGKGEPLFTAVFGFGPRICPGRYFADSALWNAMACILATLEIVPTTDEVGNERVPEVAFTEGLISRPCPFEYEVRLRSDAAQVLISQIEAS